MAQLGVKTMVGEVLRILMQQVMELRGGCDREGGNPERQDQSDQGEPDDATRLLVCKPRMHWRHEATFVGEMQEEIMVWIRRRVGA